MVRGPFWRSGSGRETLPEVQKRSGDPSLRSRIGRGKLPEDQKWSGTLSKVRKWLGDAFGGPELVG